LQPTLYEGVVPTRLIAASRELKRIGHGALPHWHRWSATASIALGISLMVEIEA